MQVYETLNNEIYDIDLLPLEHQRVYEEAKTFFENSPKWTDFSNCWLQKISSLLPEKSDEKSRRKFTENVIFRICQDMDSRLAIAQGLARRTDYRDVLASIIEDNFSSRYAFCKKTGIDETFLSHVLKGNKNFSIAKLQSLLDLIGYEIHIRKKVDSYTECSSTAVEKNKTPHESLEQREGEPASYLTIAKSIRSSQAMEIDQLVWHLLSGMNKLSTEIKDLRQTIDPIKVQKKLQVAN